MAIDMDDVQQLLEEMPLWYVHFQIYWVSTQLLLFGFSSLHDTKTELFVNALIDARDWYTCGIDLCHLMDEIKHQ